MSRYSYYKCFLQGNSTHFSLEILVVYGVLAHFKPKIHKDLLTTSNLHVPNYSNTFQYILFAKRIGKFWSKISIKIFEQCQVFMHNFLWKTVLMLPYCILLMRTKSINQ